MPSATVAICTRNRAALLEETVGHAVAEARRGDGEVLVVDNASTDATPALLAELERRHAPTLRTVREPVLGLSAARNRALAEARGPVVAFLDDDALPCAGWLARLCEPYRDPGVACVGGRIRLRFATPPPAWLAPALHPALSAFDLGDEPRALRYGRADYPYGANISFRLANARAQGGFSTDMGLRGDVQRQHEEIDLCYRLERAGGEIRYAPDACVEHHIFAERLTPGWFLARHAEGGRSAAVFVLRNRGLLRALWRVRWLYARALLAVPYVPRDPIDPARFVRECRRREALGYLAGLARALPQLGKLRR